jgi:hypothetical protein
VGFSVSIDCFGDIVVFPTLCDCFVSFPFIQTNSTIQTNIKKRLYLMKTNGE